MTEKNVCFFSGESMRPWITVPCDWRAPERATEPFRVFWADDAQFGWLFPRPSPTEIQSFYDVPDYYTHGFDRVRQPRTLQQRLLTRAAWAVDDGVEIDAAWVQRTFGAAHLQVCDIGAGNGDLLDGFVALGHDCVGLEPDPKAVAECSRKRLTVFQGTAEDMPAALAARRFDFVFMSHVLEHTRDPARAIANAAALLKPGGIIAVETPNNACDGALRGGFAWSYFDVPRHLCFFTRKSLRATVEFAGLQVVRTEFRGFTRQFKPEWLDEEQRIWDQTMPRARALALAPLPARPTFVDSWRQLARASVSPDERRYDSVRVIARRPA